MMYHESYNIEKTNPDKSCDQVQEPYEQDSGKHAQNQPPDKRESTRSLLAGTGPHLVKKEEIRQ